MKTLITFCKTTLAPVLMWRIAILLVMAAAFAMIPHVYDYPELHSNNPVLEGTTHWDGVWYSRLVEQGYGTSPELAPTTAFFPLFPYLVKGVMSLGISKLMAVLIVNLAATIGAAWFLVEIAKKLVPTKFSRVLWLFLAFPSAFFLSVMYTEAVFCLTTFGAFYFFLKEKGFWAAVFALFASMTRISGLFVGGIIALAWLIKKDWFKGIGVGVASILGVLIVMLIQSVTVGDPLAFIHIHDTYFTNEHASLNIFATFKDWLIPALHPKNAAGVIQYTVPVIAYLGAWVLTIWGAFKKIPWWATAFSAINLLFFLFTDASSSILRYILPLFPMYLTLALVQSKEVNRAWIIASSVLMGLGAALFATWYWIS